jgi:hypothetical protein
LQQKTFRPKKFAKFFFHLNCFRGNDFAAIKHFRPKHFSPKNFFDPNCFCGNDFEIVRNLGPKTFLSKKIY